MEMKTNNTRKPFTKKQFKKSKDTARGMKGHKEYTKPYPIEIPGKPVNDVNWYMISENIGKAGASLPFNVFSGTREFLNVGTGTNIVPINMSPNATPGILCLEYFPTMGSAEDGLAAMNVASRAIYSKNRMANSGARNYEAPDFMCYNLALDNLAVLITEAKRIYRIAMTYSTMNRYIPDLLLTALGVSPNNIRDNLAQFRYGLNLRIAKMSSMAFPKTFKLFERHNLLATLVLTDSDSIRSQFYVFHATHYYQWSPRTSEKGTELILKEKGTDRTYIDVLDEIDACLNILLIDEDANLMSGDILKAWGLENCHTFTELAEEETQQFIHDEDLLNQIENSFAIPMTRSLQDFNISQDGGALYAPYEFSVAVTEDTKLVAPLIQMQSKKYFNSHKNEPDWRDVLEWSRLIMTGTYLNGVVKARPASEYLHGYKIYTYSYLTPYADPRITCYDFNSVIPWDNIMDPDATQFILTTLAVSLFDWHPILYYWYTTNSPDQSGWKYYGASYDSKVHTIVDMDTFTRLNDLAIMGLFMTDNMK